jgi:putative colanic acid biosynthesis UDP-glucose lipid carrier transferase
MNRHAIRFFQTVIAGLDLLAINLVIFLAHILLDTYIPPGYMTYYFRFWLFFNTAWLLLSWLFSVYNEYTIVTFETLSRKTMKAYLSCLAFVVAYLFFFRQFELSRLFVLTVLPAVGFFLFINRIIYLLFRHLLHKRASMDRKIIILGYNEVAKKLASYLEGNLNTRIVGFCAEQGQVTELSHYPIVGNLHNVMRLVEQLGINEIYTTIGPEQDRFIYNVIQQADQQCIRFRIIPDFSFFINQTVHIDYLRDMPVLSLRSEPLESLSSRLRKRFFDVVVSSLITVFILSWLIPLISLLIWLESKGPIFFVQQRSGKNNRTFYCIKFRSMRVNKDANLRQAKRNDDRLTRIGNFYGAQTLMNFRSL